MAITGKSKSGEAGRKTNIARADARASQLAPIVADIRASGITSWYSIAMELNKRGIPTATGRGIWEPGRVRRVMERLAACRTELRSFESGLYIDKNQTLN